MARSTSRVPRRSGYYVLAGLLAVFSLGPLLVLAFNSLKTPSEQGANPLGPPLHPVFSNFPDAWNLGHFATSLPNSIVIVAGTICGVWIVAGLAAYALARLNVGGGGRAVFYLVLVSAIPPQLFVVPLFFLWVHIGLMDTLPGLILIYIGLYSPLATLLLRSYMIGLPRDYEDAARVEGANELQVLLRVTLPLTWPGFLTVGLVAGLSAWNEFFFAVTFIQDQSRMPVVTSLWNFEEAFTRDWGLTSAGAIFMALPTLVIFLLLQRHFVAGLAAAGLKG